MDKTLASPPSDGSEARRGAPRLRPGVASSKLLVPAPSVHGLFGGKIQTKATLPSERPIQPWHWHRPGVQVPVGSVSRRWEQVLRVGTPAGSQPQRLHLLAESSVRTGRWGPVRAGVERTSISQPS